MASVDAGAILDAEAKTADYKRQITECEKEIEKLDEMLYASETMKHEVCIELLKRSGGNHHEVFRQLVSEVFSDLAPGDRLTKNDIIVRTSVAGHSFLPFYWDICIDSAITGTRLLNGVAYLLEEKVKKVRYFSLKTNEKNDTEALTNQDREELFQTIGS